MPVHIPRNPRLPATFPERSRRQLRDEALRPVRRFEGTVYPCTASELQDATTRSNRPARRAITGHQANINILSQNVLGNHISRDEHAAVRRLEDAILGVFAGRYWSPDLIVKAFCDLDLVFFRGHLRGHVHVLWQPGHVFPARARHSLTMGRTDYLGAGKAVIRLNADAIYAADTALSAFKETWRTMLHEMCHAYEFTQVASREWQRHSMHSRYFGTKIHAVHERARREIHVGALQRGETYHTIH